MNKLTKSLLEGLLPENKNKIVALYGGGFKPPIGGHFEVVDEALKQYPEIDELIILVGSGERNGISQAEAILIWEIYQDYLYILILPVNYCLKYQEFLNLLVHKFLRVKYNIHYHLI